MKFPIDSVYMAGLCNNYESCILVIDNKFICSAAELFVETVLHGNAC